jgi:hypothetical protein
MVNRGSGPRSSPARGRFARSPVTLARETGQRILDQSCFRAVKGAPAQPTKKKTAPRGSGSCHQRSVRVHQRQAARGETQSPIAASRKPVHGPKKERPRNRGTGAKRGNALQGAESIVHLWLRNAYRGRRAVVEFKFESGMTTRMSAHSPMPLSVGQGKHPERCGGTCIDKPEWPMPALSMSTFREPTDIPHPQSKAR